MRRVLPTVLAATVLIALLMMSQYYEQNSFENISDKIYRNDECGFSFSYPLKVVLDSGIAPASFTEQGSCETNESGELFSGMLSPIGMTITVQKKPKDFQDLYLFVKSKNDFGTREILLSSTEIDGRYAVEYNLEGTTLGTAGSFIREIYVEHRNLIFLFSLEFIPPERNSSDGWKIHETFSNILKTVELFFTENDAYQIIKALPEVQEFLKRVKQWDIRVEDKPDLDVWRVQVYEDANDHIATFGWYQINKKDGKVIPLF